MTRDGRSGAAGGPDVGGVRTTTVVSAVTVMVAMPSFLTAASAVLMRPDLGFDQEGLGIAIGVFFGASAAISVIGGQWSERIGAGRTLALMTVGSAVVLLAIATVAQNFGHLLILLGIGGGLNGVTQPAASLALARGVEQRQGLMFGVKQSAIPMASLLAGASVPLVGVALGWRTGFVLGAGLAVIVAVAVPWRLAPPSPRVRSDIAMREGDAGMTALVTLSVAAGVGIAAMFTLPSFLVESAVDGGISLASAGWVLVAASIASIGGRLVAGWWIDRRQGALIVAAVMLTAGAVGFAMLALGGPAMFTVGAFVAYGLGGGWTGLLMYAIVRLNPNAPAAATGIVLSGAAAGAALGPFAFGLGVTRLGFGMTWMIAGGTSLAAAGLLLGARFWLIRDRDRAHDAAKHRHGTDR